ncbi:MAG: type III secretion chaperone [Chlamydiota bacterium]
MMNWQKILHWSKEELEDLRYVGYSYLQQGSYEIALTIFQALIVVPPTLAYDLQTIGALYLQTNNNAEALHHLERALSMVPDHYPSLLNRAKALYALGHKRQAYLQSKELENCVDPHIAKKAAALAISYQ